MSNPSLGILHTVGDQYVTRLELLTSESSFLNPYTPGLYDQFPTGSPAWVAIPAKWVSPMLPVTTASSRVIGQMKRYWIDYNATAPLGPPTIWNCTPVDAAGALLDSGINAPVNVNTSGGATPIATQWVSSITPVPQNAIMRANQDNYSEIKNDLLMVVTNVSESQDTEVEDCVAELYGVGVEFQKTREQRGASS